MIGTILIVILVLALLGVCRGGRIVGVGATVRPAEWGSPFSSLSFSWFSGAFEPCASQQSSSGAIAKGGACFLSARWHLF